MKKHKLRAVAHNVFAGGFSIGVRKHFNVLAHFEESDYGVATVRKNYPDLPIHYGHSEWPVDDPQFSELDFIYGNPPCAAWSVAGYTKTKGADKWKTDPRVQCTVRAFELLEKLRPKVWATESVTQAYSKGQEFWRSLEERARNIGYNTYYVLHDTQWLGVPQSRKRVIVVFNRVEIGWPAPNWAPPETALECLNRTVPTRLDWTVKIEPLVAKHLADGGKTIFDMPAGQRVRTFWEGLIPEEQWKIGERGQVIGRPSFGHKRLSVDRPSDVIVGYALVHPTEPRFITINEMAALCGFPPDYQFVAKAPGAAASLIARGVCPPIGDWLGNIVAQAIKKDKAVTTPETHHVELRDPPAENARYDHVLRADRPIELEIASSRHHEPGEPRPPKAPKAARVGATPRAQLCQGGPIREPDRNLGRMFYLQQLIRDDRFTAEQMVTIIKHHWPESKVSTADVSTQRRQVKLLDDGVAPPDLRKHPTELLALPEKKPGD